MTTTKRKLSELVFDFDLYPRAEVDSQHVSAMRESARAGCVFPPYVIDAKSLRVIDGFHRGRKDRMENGPDCEVECIEKTYANEGEMFLDAMRCNAAHGRALTPYDRARCALKCRKYRIGMAAIGLALGMTVAALKAIGEGRTAHVRSAANADNGNEVALKRTIRHMAGKTLTVGQNEANKRLSGMEPAFYANQLLLLVENDLLDLEDQSLMSVLGRLHATLEKYAVAASGAVA